MFAVQTRIRAQKGPWRVQYIASVNNRPALLYLLLRCIQQPSHQSKCLVTLSPGTQTSRQTRHSKTGRNVHCYTFNSTLNWNWHSICIPAMIQHRLKHRNQNQIRLPHRLPGIIRGHYDVEHCILHPVDQQLLLDVVQKELESIRPQIIAFKIMTMIEQTRRDPTSASS